MLRSVLQRSRSLASARRQAARRERRARLSRAAPPAARRPPRRRAWRRCGGPRSWPPRTCVAHAAGSASSSSSARSAASASSTARSACSCSRRRFFDGPFGLALRLAVGRRGSRSAVQRRRRRRSRLAARRARRRRARAARVALAARGAALLAHAHVLRPAADVAAQRPVLDGDRARADRVEQRAVVGDEQDRARERRAARPRAPRATRGRGGWSARRGSARWRRCDDEDRQRQPPALAAREAGERLLGLLAAEQEAPEQRARLVRREAGRALRRLEHALPGMPPAPSSSACWER